MGFAVALTVGVTAAAIGGPVEALAMRAVDVVLAISNVVLTLAVLGVLGPGFGNLLLALVVSAWAYWARLARSFVLDARSRPDVVAARLARIGFLAAGRSWRAAGCAPPARCRGPGTRSAGSGCPTSTSTPDRESYPSPVPARRARPGADGRARVAPGLRADQRLDIITAAGVIRLLRPPPTPVPRWSWSVTTSGSSPSSLTASSAWPTASSGRYVKARPDERAPVGRRARPARGARRRRSTLGSSRRPGPNRSVPDSGAGMPQGRSRGRRTAGAAHRRGSDRWCSHRSSGGDANGGLCRRRIQARPSPA